jgi:Carboxypeptidase regulatory-like domain
MTPQFRVISPCPKEWGSLEGGGDVRFCSQCKKQVFDISKLPEHQVAVLFASRSVCGRVERPNRRGFLQRVAAFWALMPRPSYAEAMTVTGVVTDPSGAYVVQAKLTLSGSLLPEPITAQTDSTGRFRLAAPVEGEFTLSIESNGFLRKNFNVRLGEQGADVGTVQLDISNVDMGLLAVNAEVLTTEAPPVARRSWLRRLFR